MWLYRLNTVPGTWGSLEARPRTPEEIDAEARELLAKLTLDEKLAQMTGDTPPFRGTIEMLRSYNARPFSAGENHRLGIPGLRFTDGPRGVAVGRSTCFPVAIARGATWDVDLEARIGDAIGVEARAQGANFFGGVCINVLRHPAWGRAQETYGEEPHHLGEMGAALVRGTQRHVMACVKHYAANSMENARFKVDVRLDERTLHEVYLPHFRRCVREGAAAIMSAYNRVNGRYCGHDARLLRDILKGAWRFDGLVMSDFVFGVYNARAAEAGLDVEMPFSWRFGRRLKRRVRRGDIDESAVDDAALRVVRQKVRFAGVGEPGRYEASAVACDAHRALAREAACKSIVLLRNRDRALPLEGVSRLAVIGRLAVANNVGDLGSSRVRPPSVVSPLEGLRAGDVSVDYASGRSLRRARKVARAADAAVVVVGYTHRDEGEYIIYRGGDRDRLTLRPRDERLIAAVAELNPRTIVVLIGGSAIITEAWRESVAAILMAWYPGMEGGHAIADVLFGRVNPSAKLPLVFPASSDDLPPFDKNARSVDYGYLHGQRKLDRDRVAPAFPFGFGLSYTTFSYENLTVEQPTIGPDDTLVAHVDVTNAGSVAGDEIVQLYVGYDASRVERAVRELKAFARVSLGPSQSKRVRLTFEARDLAYYDAGDWIVELGDHSVWVGPSSQADRLQRARFRVSETLGY